MNMSFFVRRPSPPLPLECVPCLFHSRTPCANLNSSIHSHVPLRIIPYTTRKKIKSKFSHSSRVPYVNNSSRGEQKK